MQTLTSDNPTLTIGRIKHMTRQKNLLGKSRKTDTPYAIFKGYGPFGET